MIQLIPSEARYHVDRGWLSTYWHFSFDEYYDPANMHWSALRVFNDDVIRPGGGFGFHPHRDMEIFTYVLEGSLEHQDSLGNTGVVEPGEVQVMSAGTGITHAEYNHSKQAPVHLMQLWILPRTKGLKPRWEQRRIQPEQRAGKLLPVVSDGSMPETLAIDQDATIFLSRLGAGRSVSFESRPGRHAYLYVIDGSLSVNQQLLAAGGQARIAGEPRLDLAAKTDSELLFLDLP